MQLRMGGAAAQLGDRADRNSDDNVLYENIFGMQVLKHSGNWSVWDGQSVYPSTNPSQECNWLSYTAQDQTAQICTHPTGPITQQIEEHGHWVDCANMPRTDGVFVDVGANIGSCVLDMLLTTTANVIAVEPHPINLFCLTNTLLGLSSDMQSRVLVIPAALGADDTMSAIHTYLDEPGMSSITGIFGGEETTLVPIHMFKADTIFHDVSSVDYLLVDVEGYECEFATGARGSLIRAADVFSMEFNQHHLNGAGCSRECLRELVVDTHDLTEQQGGSDTDLIGHIKSS